MTLNPTCPSTLTLDGNPIGRRVQEAWPFASQMDQKSHKKPQLSGHGWNLPPKPLFQRLASRGAPGTTGPRSLCQGDCAKLELLADECEDEKTRSHALKIVQEYSNRFTRLKAKFRSISLKLKRTNTTHQSQRAELLKGSSTTNSSESDPSSSSDVTKSLQNTLEIMRQELDRSVMSTHLLEQQTSTLQSTSDQYMNFGGLMKTSKALISSLKRAETLIFFGLVCLYILEKRILDKGVSIISTLISPLSRMDKSRENLIDKTNPIYD
ncbi:hypothetical protein PSTG_12747 [Puccinia striiformis f. sp. tritici PST-78]|uniref:Sec20 C-terminal domain-containing protein n=1 Tax=Puccinia striiformis f. sp. tritici PST-78 TaxID=1165861 RepID=A0A0L0V3S8_9BASI|nr:hypothetical protein PSTG_12747 [Puccinia striiformis f. sp. tritici PST-78]